MPDRGATQLPDTWNAENVRMFEQLRDQHLHDGLTDPEARERAIREVNEHRREPARSESPEPGPVGAPSPAPERRPLAELRDEARGLGLDDPDALDREQLLRAIAEREAGARRE